MADMDTADENNDGLTERQILALEVFEAKMGNVSETCKAIGIGRTGWYYYVDSSEVFAARVAEIKESLIDRSESMLHQLIGEGHWQSIHMHLKTKGRDRGYVERVAQDETQQTADELRAAMERGKARVEKASEDGPSNA